MTLEQQITRNTELAIMGSRRAHIGNFSIFHGRSEKRLCDQQFSDHISVILLPTLAMSSESDDAPFNVKRIVASRQS